MNYHNFDKITAFGTQIVPANVAGHSTACIKQPG